MGMKAQAVVVGRGGESLLCDPGSELRLLIGGIERRRPKIYKGKKKKIK